MTRAYECERCAGFHRGDGGLVGRIGVARREAQVSLDSSGMSPFMRVQLILTSWTDNASPDICAQCCKELIREGLVKLGWLLDEATP